MPTSKKLSPGDSMPDFTLTNHAGKQVSVVDYRGSKVVMYFFPEAATPGCTLEAVEFNSAIEAFQELGYEVVGVSRDSVEKLAKFRERHRLAFDLLSDPELVAHKATGAWGEKHLFGRVYEGMLRSTFVFDAAGKVEHAYYSVSSIAHVPQLLKVLEA